eukprot:7837943-Alexandrium_andersonii.AAC.1
MAGPLGCRVSPGGAGGRLLTSPPIKALDVSTSLAFTLGLRRGWRPGARWPSGPGKEPSDAVGVPGSSLL